MSDATVMSDALDVLVADNDPATAMPLQQGLSTLGCAASYAGDSDTAVALATKRRPDLAIIQLDMPGAFEAARNLHSGLRIPVVLCIDREKGPLDINLNECAPLAFLSKPLRNWELAAMVPAITRQIEDSKKERQRNLLLSGIVDNLLDAVIVVDTRGSIQFANSTAARLLKRKVEEILTLNLTGVFPPDADGNLEIRRNIDALLFGAAGTAVGSGGRGTIIDSANGRVSVIALANPIRNGDSAITAVSLSFRSAPGSSGSSNAGSSAGASAAQNGSAASRTAEVAGGAAQSGTANAPSQTAWTSTATAASASAVASDSDVFLDLGGRGENGFPKLDPSRTFPYSLGDPLRDTAIRAMAMRMETKRQFYAVALVLSQFDMFRTRYGLTSAERLLLALSAQVMKTLPPEDRLYQWSNRALVALCERETSPDQVRLEMTALCSRRIDYFLNATERSALVTLSASWTLMPLFAGADLEKLVEQIDAFQRQHSRSA